MSFFGIFHFKAKLFQSRVFYYTTYITFWFIMFFFYKENQLVRIIFNFLQKNIELEKV